MRRPSKWWLLALIPALLWGCARLLYQDKSEQIAMAILYNQKGNADPQAFAGALQGRFPAGTPADEVERFATGLGGRCYQWASAANKAACVGASDSRPPECASAPVDTLSCTIPIAGTLCVSYNLFIRADLDGQKRTSGLTASAKTEAC